MNIFGPHFPATLSSKHGPFGDHLKWDISTFIIPNHTSQDRLKYIIGKNTHYVNIK